eukprot:126398_1
MDCCHKFPKTSNKAIRKGKPLDASFNSEEVCLKLLNLQKLFSVPDHAIMDNGYKITHSMRKAPKDPPRSDDRRLDPCQAVWARSITAMRNTQERFNGWAKGKKMLKAKLETTDIPNIQWVWSIVAADMIMKDCVLREDDEASELLTDQILMCRTVNLNPLDIYRVSRKQN